MPWHKPMVGGLVVAGTHLVLSHFGLGELFVPYIAGCALVWAIAAWHKEAK